ncbi:MAG: hypothetical protein ACFFD5_06065 [Candidatus Thorarchaeota archaeon]
MAKKHITLIFVIIVVSFSFIFSVPVLIISSHLSIYGVINESFSLKYSLGTPDSIETLNLYVDVGNIEIKYIEPPFDYHVKTDLDIKMGGANVVQKSYLDYFIVLLENSSSSAVNFTFKIRPNLVRNEVLSLVNNITIIVSLRPDIAFDIITLVNDGNCKITVPFGVSIGNILTNISRGNLLYNFVYCTIGGNITGIVNKGNIELMAIDAKYNTTNNWNLTIETGNLDINVNQNRDLGGNITGLVEINNGMVFLFYNDNNPNIGAQFKVPYWNNWNANTLELPVCLSITAPCLLEGFDRQPSALHEPWEGIIEFTSYDFLTVNNSYEITFEIFKGRFDMDLTSFPYT